MSGRYGGFPPNPFDPLSRLNPEPECNGESCKLSREWKPEHPPGNCLYSTCTNTFAIRVHYPMTLGFDDGGSYKRDEPQPVFICPTHSRLIHAALEKGLVVRMTPEGTVWIDNTDFIRFRTL